MANLGEFDKPHFEMEPRLRGPAQVILQPQQHVEKSDEILFGKVLRARGKRALLVGAAEDLVFEAEFQNEEIADPAYEFPNILLKIEALVHNDADGLEQRLRVAPGQRIQRPIQNFGWNEAQDIANVLVDHILSAEGDDLIQKRLRVTHASFRRFDDVAEGSIVDFHSFAFGDLTQVSLDFGRRNRPEDKLLTTRQDGRRQLVALGCRHDEDDV